MPAVRIPTIPDLVRLGQEQIEALASLPESIALLNRSLASFAQTVTRLDTQVKRLDRLTEPLEEPLSQLAPRLQALVPLLDEDLLAALPAVLDSVARNAIPALEVIGQTQSQVATIASSVERLMTGMDDTVARLADLPGIGLVSRLRAERPSTAGRSTRSGSRSAAGSGSGASPASRSSSASGAAAASGTPAPAAASSDAAASGSSPADVHSDEAEPKLD